MLRQNQRALNKAMRDLDRERQHMEQQEKKIIADIKKMAKQGQMVLFCLLSYYLSILASELGIIIIIIIIRKFIMHT